MWWPGSSKYKGMAILIRSFLETAVNPKFQISMYHQALFLWHVRGSRNIPDPGRPPYYSLEMFEIIREVDNSNKFDIIKMKGKDWYIYLLDKYVLKSDIDENNQQNIVCKAEAEKPNVNWETSWQLARLGGLGSPSITFLWRMLHNILPTKQRLNRVTRTVNSPLCTKCDMNVEDDLKHALLKCPYNR